MKEARNSEQYAALVGIDWGDKKHDICLKATDGERVEHWVVQHSPEELDGWAKAIQQPFGGAKIAVCVEQARGPLISLLLQHEFIDIYPVNPQTLARHRDAWHPSGAKDDPTDAKLALEVLQKHRDKLKQLRPQSAGMRALRRLVEDRRRLVNDRVRVTNRITAALKAYYPQPLDWFEEKGTIVFCNFVERWTSAEEARRARPATLRSFFTAHNVRHRSVVDARIEAIKAAVPLTTDPGVVTPAMLLVKSLLPQLKALLEAIKAYDAEIQATCSQLPDFRIFESFPCASTVFAPRLLAAFGEDRSVFTTAAEVQRYGGIAPVTERSGKQKWVHWRFKASVGFTWLRLKADDGDIAIERHAVQCLEHAVLHGVDALAAGASSDEREGDGPESMQRCQFESVADGQADRLRSGSPQQADTSDMDDGAMRQATR